MDVASPIIAHVAIFFATVSCSSLPPLTTILMPAKTKTPTATTAINAINLPISATTASLKLSPKPFCKGLQILSAVLVVLKSHAVLPVDGAGGGVLFGAGFGEGVGTGGVLFGGGLVDGFGTGGPGGPAGGWVFDEPFTVIATGAAFVKTPETSPDESL